MELADRFWKKVLISGTNDCWHWKACKNNKGYGQFKLKSKTVLAHKMSWELTNRRPFPKGKVTLHLCDNPPCVNPKHLKVGTQNDNVQDCKNKGRINIKTALSVWTGFRKTHCKHGHAYTAENTYIPKNRPIQRMCRVCMKIRKLKEQEARKKHE